MVSHDPDRFESDSLKDEFFSTPFLIAASLEGKVGDPLGENIYGTLGIKDLTKASMDDGQNLDGSYAVVVALENKASQWDTPEGKIFLKDSSSRVRFTTNPIEKGREFSVAEAYLAVNPDGSPVGLLQGPIRIEQKNQDGKNLIIQWNGAEHRLAVQDLNLALGAKGIQIRPLIDFEKYPFIEPDLTSLGFDGAFRGSYSLFLPEDRKKWKGNGAMILSGDGNGDMQLYGTDGSPYGPSLFRNTHWEWRNIDRIHWNRRRLMGDFNVYTDANPRALFSGAQHPDLLKEDRTTVYGDRGEKLRPYEIVYEMNYDNQPWDPRGFANVVVDYLYKLCLQDPDCSNQIKGKARSGVSP